MDRRFGGLEVAVGGWGGVFGPEEDRGASITNPEVGTATGSNPRHMSTPEAPEREGKRDHTKPTDKTVRQNRPTKFKKLLFM